MSKMSSFTSLCANVLGPSPEIGRSVWRNLHTSRCLLFATHYDTLKVKRDCTHKDIREAFIKLSKEFHPDKNLSNPGNHARFVKLNEAYTILSKPYRRADYDLSLVPSETILAGDKSGPQQNGKGPFKDDSFWEQRDKSKDKFYKGRPYYGIAGIKKLPNSWIVVFCIFFTVLGAGLQFIAISKSATFDRQKMDEVSVHNSLLHHQARQQAMHNGNEVQIQLLRKRLLNPSANTETVNNVKRDV